MHTITIVGPAGPAGLLSLGIVGSASWVAVSHVMSTALTKASKDAQRFALAEREATDWQAAQEAHVYERQFRLGQTSAMALAMLRIIQERDGDLTDEQRQECLHLEGAIRDEIRGRKLLNDAVREEVMSARRRGATVTLLDEGGIDDLSEVVRSAAFAAAVSEELAARGLADRPIRLMRFRCVRCGTPAQRQLRPPALPPAGGTGWIQMPRASSAPAGQNGAPL